jgi:diguanylate cyclase (GGDEF)-like protein
MGTAMDRMLGSAAPVASATTPRLPGRDDGARARREESTRALAGERFAASNTWFWVSSILGSVVLVVLLGAAVPTYGWIPLLLLGTPALVGSIATFFVPDLPERMYAIAHLVWLVFVGVCAGVAGGADSFLLPLLPTLALGFFSRLRPAAAAGYAWAAFGLASAAVLVTDWDGFVRAPWMLCSCAVGMVSLTLFASQMAAGELRHRGEATVDQLTGLLNRRGLKDRLAELRQQALVIGDDTQMAFLACDLDRFKLINDTHGHARGDDVLRDVAYILRKQLRRFELAYRMGGEEFLIVLPGHGVADAAVVAEAIRKAIADGTPGGLEVTVSIGVAAGVAADVDADDLLREADGALFAAKRAGRNRVMVTAHDGAPAVEHA